MSGHALALARRFGDDVAVTPADIISIILMRISENLAETEAVKAYGRTVGANTEIETRLSQARVEAVRTAWRERSQHQADPIIALRESMATANVTPWGFGWDNDLGSIVSLLDKLKSEPDISSGYVWDAYIRALELVIRTKVRQ